MKLLRIISLGLCLMLCGCKDNNLSLNTAVSGYECLAEITCGDEFSAKASVDVAGGGILNISLLYPEMLNGLNFSVSRDGLKISYRELDGEAFLTESYGGFAEIMGEAFLKLGTGAPEAEKEGKYFVYENTLKNQAFKFIINHDGFPQKLEVPSQNLTVDFSNWKYKT